MRADYGPVERGLAGVGLGLDVDAAVEEEFYDWVASVFAGPEQGAFFSLVCEKRVRCGFSEESFHFLETTEAGGCFQV